MWWATARARSSVLGRSRCPGCGGVDGGHHLGAHRLHGGPRSPRQVDKAGAPDACAPEMPATQELGCRACGSSPMMAAMGAVKMHADVETDAALVGRLIAGQFPQWIDLPIEPVVSYGTDHDI